MDRRKLLKAGAAIAALGACDRGKAPATPADLADLDAIALAARIREGHLTAAEAVEAAAARIEALNGELGAFFSVNIDQALERARRPEGGGPLWGVPYAMKDLNNYPGLAYTRGSALFKDAMGDAITPYTAKLDEAGLITLGKTATPEFGLLSTTEPLAFPPAKNPWNTAHSTGGSSGGAAAAVAARLLPAAQGSDGGGSIRIPSSSCGVFGMKPSRGRFPEQGNPFRLIELSIKHALSRSVRDNAFILALSESEDGPFAPVGFADRKETGALKIAMTLTENAGLTPHPTVVETVQAAADLLQSMGHEIVPTEQTPVQTPGFGDAFGVIWAQTANDIYQLAAGLTGAPPEETGVLEPFTIGLAKAFQAEGAAALEGALALLHEAERRTLAWFDTYDAWLTPVTGAPPPKLGYFAADLSFDMLLERLTGFVGYTPLHNVAGTPAMSVPFTWTEEDLPVGVQISSGPGKEGLLFDLAYALEEARPWADKKPSLIA